MEEGRALGGQWERQLRGWVSGQESLGFCRFQLLSRKSIAILSTASWVSFDLALNCAWCTSFVLRVKHDVEFAFVGNIADGFCLLRQSLAVTPLQWLPGLLQDMASLQEVLLVFYLEETYVMAQGEVPLIWFNRWLLIPPCLNY